MSKQRLSRRLLWLASGLAVVLAAVAVPVVARDSDSDGQITAVFANAGSLIEGNVVKAHGVQVGTVSGISLQANQARVAIQLETPVRLHRDARAAIRPVTLLGERYIALDPGSPASPVMDPPVVGARQTSSSVDVDEVLNTVDDPTGTALAAMITSLGEGSRGQGRQIADTIKALRPAMTQAGALAGTLNQQNDLLNSLIEKVSPVADSLAADRGKRLDRLVGSTTTALNAAASQRKAINSTLARLPATLNKAERTLGKLSGVATSGTSVLRSARPVTDNLTDITGELKRLADAADPALAGLRPVLDRAEKLLDQAGPLVSALRPAGPKLEGVAESARPIMKVLDSRLRDALDFIKFWALSTNGYDGISHYFRGALVATPDALAQAGTDLVPGGSSLLPGLGAKPPPPPAGAAGPPTTEDESGSTPPAETKPGQGTGLTKQQEQGLIGQLLGGR